MNLISLTKFKAQIITSHNDKLQYTLSYARQLRDQYIETNVMYFLFNLLRIKGLYMFRALLSHPQEALHVTFGVLRVLCQLAAPGCSQLALHTCSIPNAIL
jgi:hypothetical protein